MKKSENIFYTTAKHPSQVLDVYLPDADTFPVFIYFHGGGIEAGDKEGYPFYKDLPEKGIAVVTANYRLYPEAAFPEFLKDAASVVAWAQKNMPEYGNVTGYYVGGSSAGGYLTQMLCFDKRFLAEHQIDADTISGYIMDAGQPTVHFNVLRERGIDSRRVLIDEAAPIYHICEERCYPPMYIIVSDDDMQNRYEQTILLASTLRHFGHEDKVTLDIRKNSTHCSYVGAVDDAGRSIFGDMVYKFISTHTKGI